MANSLFQQMNATQNQTIQGNGLSQQIQSIKKMANMLKGQKNPMQVLQMVAGQNPQLSQVMNMLNGSGMSAKQMFNSIAQQRGIDQNQIMDILK